MKKNKSIKYYNRVCFSWKEKEEALSKSKHKCAHCGKSLTKETCTVEHVVPLSRGGSNDSVNLVALCEKCNKEKGSKMVVPEEYYRHLVKSEIKAVQSYFNNYCDEVDWFRCNNLFMYDKVSCNVERYVFGTKFKPIKAPVRVDAVKAVYSDLDEIYMFLLDYAQEYLDDDFIHNLKEMMTHVFTYGCFYYTRNRSTGKINMVIQFEYGVGHNVEGNTSYLFELQIHIYIDKSIELPLFYADFTSISLFDVFKKVIRGMISELLKSISVVGGLFGEPFIPIRLMAWGLNDIRLLNLINAVMKPAGYSTAGLTDAVKKCIADGYPYLLQLGKKNAVPTNINEVNGYSVAAGQIFMIQTMDWRLMVKLLEDSRIEKDGLYASKISDKTVHAIGGHDKTLRGMIGQSKLRTIEKFTKSLLNNKAKQACGQ